MKVGDAIDLNSFIATRKEQGAHAVARFLHRSVGQSDHDNGRQPAAEAGFDLDGDRLDADDGRALHARAAVGLPRRAGAQFGEVNGEHAVGVAGRAGGRRQWRS